MKLANLNGVAILVSPLFAVMALFFAIAGEMEHLLLGMLSLSVHELAHTLMAHSLGYQVREIELQPFGFVARLGSELLNPWDEVAVAAAGPLVSLIAALSLKVVTQRLGTPAISSLVQLNFSIAIVNLLPALPLDGGRILRGALAGLVGKRGATRVGVYSGILLGCACTALGCLMFARGQHGLVAAVFGVFLAVAAAGEGKKQRLGGAKKQLNRAASLQLGATLPIQHVLISGNTPARTALCHCGGKYTVFCITNSAMKVIGRLDECTIAEKMAAMGQGVTLAEMLAKN